MIESPGQTSILFSATNFKMLILTNDDFQALGDDSEIDMLAIPGEQIRLASLPYKRPL